MAMKKHVAAAASLAIVGVSGLSTQPAFAQDAANVDVVTPADTAYTLNLVPSASDGVQAIVTNGDSVDSAAALLRGNGAQIGSLSEIINHAGNDVLGALPTDIQNAVNNDDVQDVIQSIQSQLQNLTNNPDALDSLSNLIESLSSALSSSDGSSNLGSSGSGLSGSSNTSPASNTANPGVTSDAIQDALDNMNNTTTVNDNPDFVTTNNDGSMNVDTTGVEPGKYDINGAVTIPGQDKPVEFTATITVPDSGQASGGSTSAPSTDTNNPASTQSGFSYQSPTVKQGETVTVKPNGDSTGYTYAAGILGSDGTFKNDNPSWAQVGTDGAVTLSPGSDVQDGTYQVSVSRAKIGDAVKTAGEAMGDTNAALNDLVETATFDVTVGQPSTSSPNDAAVTTQPGNLPNNRVDAVANQPSTSGITAKDVEDRLNDSTNNGTVSGQGATATDQAAPVYNTGGQQSASANTTQQTQPQQAASDSSQQYQQPGQPSVSNAAQPATTQSMPVTGANVKPLAVIALLTAAGAVGAILYGRRRAA